MKKGYRSQVTIGRKDIYEEINQYIITALEKVMSFGKAVAHACTSRKC